MEFLGRTGWGGPGNVPCLGGSILWRAAKMGLATALVVWFAPDGEVRVQLDITASSVQFLGGGQVPGEVDINHLSQDGSEPVEAPAGAAGHAVVTDDLPF